MTNKTELQQMFSAENDGSKWDQMYSSGEPNFEKYIFQARRDYVLSLITETMAGEATILDLGCGSGPLLTELVELGYSCVGLDYSLDMLDFARKNLVERSLADSCLIQAESGGLPFPDQKFDCIASLGMISYVPDMENSVAEMHRILEDDGKLIITYRNYYRPVFFDPIHFLKHVKRVLLRGLRGGTSVVSRSPGAFLKPGEFEDLLNRSGFMVVHTESIGYGPLSIWNRKLFGESVSIRLDQAFGAIFRVLQKFWKVYASDVIVHVCKKQ